MVCKILKTHCFYFHITKGPSLPLIHRACIYGELDTLTDLIEFKDIDPCMVDEVITLIVTINLVF